MKPRHITALLLCGVFILNMFVYVPVLLVMQLQVKAEMKRAIKKGGTELAEQLLLSAEEFGALAWAEEDEFTYNNNRYDLVSARQLSNGSYLISAIPDKKEKDILNKLESQSAQSNSAKKSVQLLLNLLAGCEPCMLSSEFVKQVAACRNQFIYTDLYSSAPAELTSPPPKAA